MRRDPRPSETPQEFPTQHWIAHTLHKTRAAQTTDQLPVRPHIDESPCAVFFVHGIGVGFAEEADSIRLLYQIVDFRGTPTELPEIQTDRAFILLAAPYHFLFAFATALRQQIKAQPSRIEPKMLATRNTTIKRLYPESPGRRFVCPGRGMCINRSEAAPQSLSVARRPEETSPRRPRSCL